MYSFARCMFWVLKRENISYSLSKQNSDSVSTEKREKLCPKIDIHSGLRIPGTRKEQALLFVTDIK